MRALVISPDEIKRTLVGYTPANAELLHSESAQIADKALKVAMKTSPYKTVILLSGGSASGKTEFVRTQLSRRDAIIFDGTLPSSEGAKIKIQSAHKYSKIVEICAIIPDDLKRAYTAFLHRDRRFPSKYFFRTHAASRKTLLWIFEAFPDVKMSISESFYTSSNRLRFRKLQFTESMDKREFLEGIQISESDIINKVKKWTHNEKNSLKNK